MSLSKVFLPVLSGIFLASAALADSPAPPTPHGIGSGGGCGGIFRLLTPEERLVQFSETRKAIGDLTLNQLHDYRKTQCDKFKAMTESERQQYIDGLKAKLEALPVSEKLTLYHKALDARSHFDRGGHDRIGGGWNKSQ